MGDAYFDADSRRAEHRFSRGGSYDRRRGKRIQNHFGKIFMVQIYQVCTKFILIPVYLGLHLLDL